MLCRHAKRTLAARRTTGQTWESFQRVPDCTLLEIGKERGLGGGVSAKPLARPRLVRSVESHLFLFKYRLNFDFRQHRAALAENQFPGRRRPAAHNHRPRMNLRPPEKINGKRLHSAHSGHSRHAPLPLFRAIRTQNGRILIPQRRLQHNLLRPASPARSTAPATVARS
jgi:hypothetical protein